jgi:hypothetical protein
MFPTPSFARPGQDGYLRIVATGNYQVNIPVWQFVGLHGEILIDIVALGTLFTGTWPSNINWLNYDGTLTTSIATYLSGNPGRTALKSSGVDSVFLWTNDGGSTVYGKLL